MWLITICFHISLRKEKKGDGDKLSLSAIIESNLYLSGPTNGLNYFVLTSEVLFYGLGKLALTGLILIFFVIRICTSLMNVNVIEEV